MEKVRKNRGKDGRKNRGKEGMRNEGKNEGKLRRVSSGGLQVGRKEGRKEPKYRPGKKI